MNHQPCKGKVAHSDRAYAVSEARRLTLLNVAKGLQPVVAYECEQCGKWHVGRQAWNPRNRQRAAYRKRVVL